MKRVRRELPCPRVRFEPGFLGRIQRLVLELGASRERREGAGRRGSPGVGEEFVGYRSYRPGDDLRLLDWELLARLDAPFVRVLRREASESWTILLDRSGSMGVGPPGKLQRAAECAVALAALGVRTGANVRLVHAAPEGGAPVVLPARRSADLARLCATLEGLEARGRAGVAELFPLARGGRVFVLGDLFDLEPARLEGLWRRGRRVAVWMLQAPFELRPHEALGERREGAVEWLDAEGDERVVVQLDAACRRAFARRSSARVAAWSASARRHRFGFTVADTALPFPELLRRGVEGEL